MISETHINKLFRILWPAMPFAEEHRLTCLKHLTLIDKLFLKYNDSHNELIQALIKIDGIGATIASGLIWSVYPSKRVPFDKFTLTYALKLKLIKSEVVTKNYVQCCKSIKDFCSKYTIDGKRYTIENFVVEARAEMEFSEYIILPL